MRAKAADKLRLAKNSADPTILGYLIANGIETEDAIVSLGVLLDSDDEITRFNAAKVAYNLRTAATNGEGDDVLIGIVREK